MVRIIGREMRIPEKYDCIGFVGDNKTEIKEFEITDKKLFDFDFKLDLKIKSHVGIADLEKIIEPERIVLRWEIRKEHLPEKGMLFAQLRCFKDTEEAWHSDKGAFMIYECINATDYFPSPLPSEFEQMEQQVTSARNEVVSSRDDIIQKAEKVETESQIVSQKTEIVMQKAVEVEANTTTVAQKTESAVDSASIAAQSLADLLAMLGKDIATLTNGKLTSSQIPAIAITNTFVTNSDVEMLGLTVQTGDVCVRTDESKTYILQGTNPSILQHWVCLESPTSYADKSGHAMTADEALNASMINNHRIVYMLQSQYENAAKDPDTIYMVEVD